MKGKILFVCTGNYFRSRFAEIYFNFRAGNENLNYSAFSRGFDINNINNTGLISPHVTKQLERINLVLPPEINSPHELTLEDLLESEKIIILNENEHQYFVKKLYPTWHTEVEYWRIQDIHDEIPESALRKLQAKIDGLIKTLKASCSGL